MRNYTCKMRMYTSLSGFLNTIDTLKCYVISEPIYIHTMNICHTVKMVFKCCYYIVLSITVNIGIPSVR